MTPDERRSVLEAIARDEGAYPRDRIAAVRALEDMLKRDEDEQATPEDELEALIKR